MADALTTTDKMTEADIAWARRALADASSSTMVAVAYAAAAAYLSGGMIWQSIVLGAIAAVFDYFALGTRWIRRIVVLLTAVSFCYLFGLLPLQPHFLHNVAQAVREAAASL